MIRWPTEEPAGELLQRNVNSLMQIGGVYDFIAYAVELDHADTLKAYRLDSESKCVVDYLQERKTHTN